MELDGRELEERLFADVEVASRYGRSFSGQQLGRDGRAVQLARGTDHRLGQAWSVAFHEHPDVIDGIIYPSRLNGHVNLAVDGRAVAKLRPTRLRRLIDVAELAPVLDELEVAIAAPDSTS